MDDMTEWTNAASNYDYDKKVKSLREFKNGGECFTFSLNKIYVATFIAM